MNFWEAAGIGYLLGRHSRRQVQVVKVVNVVVVAPVAGDHRKGMDAKRAKAQPVSEHITGHKFKAGMPALVLLGHCAICGRPMSEHARRR